jgi:hypothetical protein
MPELYDADDNNSDSEPGDGDEDDPIDFTDDDSAVPPPQFTTSLLWSPSLKHRW